MANQKWLDKLARDLIKDDKRTKDFESSGPARKDREGDKRRQYGGNQR